MVELREITKENYEECLNLNIAENQEDFVSSTVHSLAQAWVYYDTAFPFAVYVNNTMVGFIMLGYYEAGGYYTLWKLLIDEIFNNDKIFVDLFESFVLLHPTEDNPRFIKNNFDLWKGIGQIIRTSIVKHSKSLIFEFIFGQI